MALKYLTDIDLNKNELQNAVIQVLATDPGSVNLKAGRLWFNSTDHYLKYYDGTNIIPLYETNIENIKAGIGNATTASSGLMSSADKATLDDIIETGGEPNQNAFSYIKVGSSTIAADTKTDTLELVAGNNVVLTPDAINDKVTIAATNTTYASGTQNELISGSSTVDKIWTPKVLHTYVASAIGAADAMRFKGTIGTGGTRSSLPSYEDGVQVGDTYRVITAGTYANQVCEIGDLIIAIEAEEEPPIWTVAQTNIDGAITDISGTSPVSVTGSGNSRTISVSNATTASSGLMSSTDKQHLNNIYSHGCVKEQYTNPALTSSNGVCTWSLATGIIDPVISVYETSTLQQVMTDIVYHSDGDHKVKIMSSSNIASGTYFAIVVGQ